MARAYRNTKAEKSEKGKEPRGMREGSKKEEVYDRKQSKKKRKSK